MSNEMTPEEIRIHINKNFILKMLELFHSEDPRERDYLKTLLHRIYGKFMVLRPFIRDYVMNFFLKVVHEHEEPNGISELLEILSAIINGFQSPLKPEYKDFMIKALLPLHKVHGMSAYHTQLQNCIT